MSATPPLHLDVNVAPMRPMQGAPPQGPGDESTWSPMSSTLIHGERDAVLVDTLVTFDQVDTLADWIDRFDKNLTAIYITHGHSDHWIGLSRLLERFPKARGLARPEVHARAVFEATHPGLSAYWQSIFPGEVPQTPVLPDRFEETSIDLEGHELDIVDIGQGDTEHSTIVQVVGDRARAWGVRNREWLPRGTEWRARPFGRMRHHPNLRKETVDPNHCPTGGPAGGRRHARAPRSCVAHRAEPPREAQCVQPGPD